MCALFFNKNCKISLNVGAKSINFGKSCVCHSNLQNADNKVDVLCKLPKSCTTLRFQIKESSADPDQVAYYGLLFAISAILHFWHFKDETGSGLTVLILSQDIFSHALS